MVLLNVVVNKLDKELNIRSFGKDSAFSRFVPSVYDSIQFDWKTAFEQEFTELFNGLMIRGAEDINEDEINIIDNVDYTEMKEIPSDTIEYYTIEKEKGTQFGLYPYIPHLLSLGEVDINGVEIIMWNKPQ